VPTTSDSYLQAAEGFLFAVRDEIDQLDLRLDDSLKIAEVFALVSIARSLSRIAPPPPDLVAVVDRDDAGHET
jgi:hypothetical protein